MATTGLKEVHDKLINMKQEQDRKMDMIPTLRDHMAMAIVAGLMARYGTEGSTEAAKLAYIYADEMMRFRETGVDSDA